MAVGKGRKLKETYHIFYGSQRNIDGDEVEHFLSCIQCEHKYHVRCLKNGAADTSRYNGNWFCQKDCEKQRGSWYENCKVREEKELLDRKLNADSEAQKNLEENLQQLRNRESELNSQEEQMRARLESNYTMCDVSNIIGQFKAKLRKR